MKILNISTFLSILFFQSTFSKATNAENIFEHSFTLIENNGFEDSQIQIFLEFLKTHKDEIKNIQISKNPVGPWEKIGSGISKLVLRHPDMGAFVFKFDNCNGNHCTAKTETKKEIENLKDIQYQISYRNLNQLKTPKTGYFKNELGEFLIAEKLTSFKQEDVEKIQSAFLDGSQVEEAMDQFSRLVSQTHLCEVRPDRFVPFKSQNSGWSYGIIAYDKSNNPIYGPYINIYDFDCVGLYYDRHEHETLSGLYFDWVAGMSQNHRIVVHSTFSMVLLGAVTSFFVNMLRANQDLFNAQ